MTSFLDAPDAVYVDDNPEREILTEPSFFIVPYWIDKTIQRSNINYIDILSSEKIKTYLSKQDIFDLIYFNYGYFKQDNLFKNIYDMNRSFTLNTNLITDLRDYISEVEANREAVGNKIMSHFTTSSDDEDEDELAYELKLVSINIIIILKPSFFVMDKEKSAQYTKTIVQTLYKLLPIHTVSKYQVFKNYLASL